MNINEYCDAIAADIIIRRYANQNNRWIARFEHCEIKEGSCLLSTSGSGKDSVDALSDYLKKIRGRRIVFNAFSDARREFVVPESLTI